MNIGSLFSGYGGLERGVQAVLGGTVAWHSDIDPGACKILAHRYPDVPNLGDITTVDWSAVEPVDVLTGGFPCQDLSLAGLRKGMRPDTRSGLWTQMAYAIDQLRPSLVVAENVRGLLSAEAHSDLEPCPWCVGDGGGVPLRALGAVLGDLADLGYDASWHGLRAADVGAPHGRFRVFVVAWPRPDAAVIGRRPAWRDDRLRTEGLVAESAPDAHRLGLDRGWPARHGRPGPADGGVVAPHSSSDGRHEGRPESARLVGGPDAALGGHDAATHADGDALRQQPVPLAGGAGRDGLRLDQRDDADGRGAASDAARTARRAPQGLRPGSGEAQGAGPTGVTSGRSEVRDVDWGAYGPAIHRWGRVLGRVAPAPTDPGKNGQPRLSPAFVEWLMGLPAGWVTDVPGLSRNEQLKALGNGVVPQQCAAALRLLLPALERAA